MNGVIKEQSVLVNDTCTDCGSYVDIGAVIDEQDTLLELDFDGESAEVDANRIVERATARFPNTQAQTEMMDQNVLVKLNFEVSVEKMIFQLENGL
ncbi:YfcZ/YiiS family protein [Shewanella sp. A25]|nr:YfcZ/YiiS family protein [Shewanella shenzhenensis]